MPSSELLKGVDDDYIRKLSPYLGLQAGKDSVYPLRPIAKNREEFKVSNYNFDLMHT